MKYHVDMKLVYEATDPEDTQIKLKETLKKIIMDNDLDIFLKNPDNSGYDRLVKEPIPQKHITQLNNRKPSNQKLFNRF